MLPYLLHCSSLVLAPVDGSPHANDQPAMHGMLLQVAMHSRHLQPTNLQPATRKPSLLQSMTSTPPDHAKTLLHQTKRPLLAHDHAVSLCFMHQQLVPALQQACPLAWLDQALQSRQLGLLFLPRAAPIRHLHHGQLAIFICTSYHRKRGTLGARGIDRGAIKEKGGCLSLRLAFR